MTNAARKAYETLEPLHVLAYFNPGLKAAQADTGLDPHAFYVGARGAPLGPCDSSVVTAAFYNFSPALIDTAWSKARSVGLDVVAARRNEMLDEQFHTILGELVTAPVITELADRYGDLASSLPLSGRALSAGWASAEIPDVPILRLWHNIAVLREWRGDNHIAALVVNGLDGIDACVFHEARLLDPSIRRRAMGRRMNQLTRGWSDDDWEGSVDRLAARGLVERIEPEDSDVAHRLTARGAALYNTLEATTDDLGESVWATPGVDALLDGTRPIVKGIIDAGVLPGTRKK
ncbi:hypothetical protein GOARA_078_00230 [Gordonia araii NBRC 100433]|uniref:Uncharacterized protein n=1 Tax=Gordonia araii NBRC 100433 TaxID=1073574 RepID=G7H6U9_9ACTN|nr:hypothetical protein [Gordonia araii]NNG95991.1 hypothetical protein [Gordonia araii NBRC 100433]GAB11574.1 hypothetical protein GOARA_078_00230 [Gordonia araii NBRC 100433]